MGGFDHLRVGQVAEGFWGAHTGSIDWCEVNYEGSLYIAEFVNTLSNVPFIFMGFYGFYTCQKAGLPMRYGISMLGLSLIAVGSLGFHMTLKWFWQLMDELPMIYVISMCSLLVFDTNPGFEMRWGRAGVMVMLASDAFITISYMCLPNPIYHQIAFASIMLFSTGRLAYLISLLPSSKDHPVRRQTQNTILKGLGIFALGFLLWNLDNFFCQTLRSWRTQLGPMGFLLELHAWWHICTMYGAYLVVAGSTNLCLAIKTNPDAFKLEGGILPHVVRNVIPEKATGEVKASKSNLKQDKY